MLLDGYVRVSKIGGRQGDGFISPDVQREQIQAWSKLMGADIAQWHHDLDYSGANTERPGFQAALERIRTRQTGGLVVARIDRFARNAADGGRVVQAILDAGGVFASAGERIDPTTPIGKAMLTIMLAMAELDLARIRENWDIATGRAVDRGVHTQVPFGYERGPGRRLVATGHADLVEEVFRRRAAGASWSTLARFLDEHVKPRRGEHWTRRAVENIVHNRAYLGEARYGRHVNPRAHEALVDEVLWRAAQAARAPRPSRSAAPALLSGLVRCAGCRHRMRAATVGQRRQLVYRCDRRHGDGVCPAPASVARDLLDAYVTARFLEHFADVEPQGLASSSDVQAAQQRLHDADRELVAYRDSARARELLGALGEGHFEQGLEARVRAVLDARAQVDRLQQSTGLVHLGVDLDSWESLSVAERRLVLTEGIDAVFLRRLGRVGRVGGIDESRVRVLWRGQAPRDLPGPGVRVELRGFDW